MDKLYIGIGGVSRSGKDSLARLLKLVLNEDQPQKKVQISSLAAPLKMDCANFVKEKLNLDVFTDKTEEKSVFREFLVWYGKVKRQQSHGKYWTSLLDQNLIGNDSDVIIIPDIRYFQYEDDEVPWLKKKSKNIFIHIQRTLDDGSFIPPANMDETINDQIIKEHASCSINIPTFSTNDQMQEEVKKIASKIYWTQIKNII